MMNETLTAIQPWLVLLAGPVASAALAAKLFGAIRTGVDREWVAAHIRFPAVWALSWLLYAPLGALLSALTLAGLISGAAATALAALTGGDVWATVDMALAALIGALLSQIAYRLGIGANAQSLRV